MRDITPEDIEKQLAEDPLDPKEFSKYLLNEPVSTKIGALIMSCDMKRRYGQCLIEGMLFFDFEGELPSEFCLYQGPLDSQLWPHGYGFVTNGDVMIKGIFYHGMINDNHAFFKTAIETIKTPMMFNHPISNKNMKDE